jgi:threonyl-tRNA synthetase
MGPPIDGGFFYDFVVDEPFTPEDLEKIEARMKELAKDKVPFEREEIPKSEAIAKFQELGQSFKKELVDEKGDDIVSCYRLGPFYDFCEARTCPIAASSRRSKSSRARRLIGRATRPTRPCSASTPRRFTTARASPNT